MLCVEGWNVKRILWALVALVMGVLVLLGQAAASGMPQASVLLRFPVLRQVGGVEVAAIGVRVGVEGPVSVSGWTFRAENGFYPAGRDLAVFCGPILVASGPARAGETVLLLDRSVGSGVVEVWDSPSPAFRVRDLQCGWGHTLALKPDGRVYSWGYNAYGQLGDGTVQNRTAPVVVKGIGGMGELSGVVQIAAGWYHSLALLSDGRVVAWGYNSCGQLGDGTTVNRSYPVVVKGPGGAGELTGVVALAAGGEFSAAVLCDGRVVTWGRNDAGQLGSGGTGNRPYPGYVVAPSGSGELTGVARMATGMGHVLAVRSDGYLAAWGWNGYGQVGDGTTTNRTRPVTVALSSRVLQVSAGWAHSLALLEDGWVASWGMNEDGRLGNGSLLSSRFPVLVRGIGGSGDLSGVAAVAAGAGHSACILGDGRVAAWGNNSVGQLGTGDTVNRTAPVVVGEVSGAALLRCRTQNMVLCADGRVLGWGYNEHGELATGDTANRLTPAEIGVP